MADLTFNIPVTIPEAHKAALVAALCKAYDYQAQVEDPETPGEMIDNPETKGQFALRMVSRYVQSFLRAHFVNYKSQTNARTVEASAKTEADTFVVGA